MRQSYLQLTAGSSELKRSPCWHVSHGHDWTEFVETRPVLGWRIDSVRQFAAGRLAEELYRIAEVSEAILILAEAGLTGSASIYSTRQAICLAGIF